MTQNKKFEVFIEHLASLNKTLNESKDSIIEYVQAIESFYTAEFRKMQDKANLKIVKALQKTNL
jgi:hypothetical protein